MKAKLPANYAPCVYILDRWLWLFLAGRQCAAMIGYEVSVLTHVAQVQNAIFHGSRQLTKPA